MSYLLEPKVATLVRNLHVMKQKPLNDLPWQGSGELTALGSCLMTKTMLAIVIVTGASQLIFFETWLK